MLRALSQKSLAGGEISPSLYARTDTVKYAVAVRTMRNFWTMGDGGGQSRSGSLFVGEVADSSRQVRLIPFVFNDEQAFVLEFGHLYMRVIQSGAHVTESAKSITGATKANPCVLSIPAHGFSTGDEIAVSGVLGMTELNGRNFKVGTTGANTVELLQMDGSNLNSSSYTTYVSGGEAARVYEIDTPYGEDDLSDLQIVQSADVLTLAHPRFVLREIVRLTDTNWTISQVSLTPSISAPTSPSNNGAAGTSGDFWVVTAVKEETFEESLASSATSSSAVASSGAPLTVSWTAVTGAIEYNIYKRKNGIYGFIGTAGTNSFVDNGIAADTTEPPPTQRNLADEMGYSFSKIADPSTLPAARGLGCAWSSSGTYLAVVHDNSPFVTIYQRSGSVLTKLSDPGTLPPDAVPGAGGHDVAWSPDESFLAVCSTSTPYITIYQRSGTTFTKLSNPGTLPGTQGNCCCWSSDGQFLVVGTNGTPYITIYQRSGTTFTKLTNPGTLPSANVGGVCFSPDDEYLVCAHTNSPYITIYQRSGTTFTKITNPTSLPASDGKSCAFSPDGSILVVGVNSSPYLKLYSVAAGVFTAISNPSDLPPAAARQPTWSKNGDLLAVASNSSPYVTIYQAVGTTFTKLTNPGTLPAGQGFGASFHPEDEFLAIAHATSPFLTVYEMALNAPAVVGYIQQRLALANTQSDPEGSWASRTGQYKNFTLHSPIQADDSLKWTMAGRQVNSVRHFVDFGKFFVFTQAAEHIVQGDAAGILTPSEINPRQVGAHGASKLTPIIAGSSILFVQARGGQVREIVPDEIDTTRSADLSVYAKHLINNHEIVDWAFQLIPHSIVWAVREDGLLLGFTYVRDQEIIAWHHHDTDGLFENVCSIPEGNEDALYVVVKRTIGSATKRYIERLTTRFVTQEEIADFVALDSALSYDGRNTDESLTMTLSGGSTWAYDELLTLTAASSFFTAADLGNEIHLEGEDGTIIRFRITAYSGVTAVQGFAHKTVPVAMRSVAISSWTRAVDEVTGLWHLEGKEVGVFADGFVVASPNNEHYGTPLTVSGGTISLPQAFGVIHVGLPFLADLESLDIDTPSGQPLSMKPKKVGQVTLKLQDSRGLWAGPKPPDDDDEDPLQRLTPIKSRRSDDGYDNPPNFLPEKVSVRILPEWNTNGRVFIRQVDPVPVTVLAIEPEFELG